MAIALALGLTGCGGGGGGGGAAGNVRPTAPPTDPAAPPAVDKPPQENPPPDNPPPSGSGGFAGGEIDVAAGQVTELADGFGGSIDLIKGGLGTLILTGSNTYSGGTIVDQGILQIGNGGTKGSIAGDVLNNAILAFDRSDDISFSGIISGTGQVQKAGFGRLLLTGANTYSGGTLVTAGTLELAQDALAGSGDIVVTQGTVGTGWTTLQVNAGASLANHILLRGGAVLNNAGALAGTDVVTSDEQSLYVAVSNHDGGSIRGSHAGVVVNASPLGTVTNRRGGVIEGGDLGVAFYTGGEVDNGGLGSIIRSTYGIGVQMLDGGTVFNGDGASITGHIAAIDLQGGGRINNSDAGSSISSAAGIAIRATGGQALIANNGGATISGSTAIYLNGGSISNGPGSTIEATGTPGGDCAGAGHCAIVVAPGAPMLPGADQLTLYNAGTIIGDVQMIPTSGGSVTLTPSGSIHGNLDFGPSFYSRMTLLADAETQRLYSDAVTGRSTFIGNLMIQGGGTWIIDTDDLKPYNVNVDGTTLQIGNGGTKGSLAPDSRFFLNSGNLVFNRSDDVVFAGNITHLSMAPYDDALVQAGTGSLTLVVGDHGYGYNIDPSHIRIDRGTLRIDNTGSLPGASETYPLQADIKNDGVLVFDSSRSILAEGAISGIGSLIQDGSASLILDAQATYSGGATVNSGSMMSRFPLPGDVTVNLAGNLGGAIGLPGVTGSLSNAGKVSIHDGDLHVGGNYQQSSTGILAISLGSRLAVDGTAAIDGGTLEITGADAGYVSNTHTNVLTATGGLTGTFDRLVKGTGVVFTATTINYDADNAWLDTTGLDVTTAAAGNGVVYTPVSSRSAQRVQGAFTQLDDKVAAGDLSGVPNEFVRTAGEFQQAPSLQAAQASLRSLSGQLHAASAAMTFETIDASNRAMADRFDDLLGRNTDVGMWTQNLSVGGDMGRAGYDGVGFQLNGWLVGSDRQVGTSGVAGFAFGQSQGRQQLDRSYDHNRSRNSEAMVYAGWLNGDWYMRGRVGFGHFEQNVDRQLLLGTSVQGVATNFGGNYTVAYGESGLRMDWAGTRVVPFLNVEYASIDRGGFAEQGAGGFGLRSGAQTVSRWQTGLGLRAVHHWNLGGGRAIDAKAGAQFRRTIASRGDVFEATFVGLRQWQPLDGIGLSRYSGVLNVGLDATLSERTSLKFGYDYQKGQRDQAQMLSAHVVMAL
ncbi:autotransporter domain-containing protein [Luteibacter sp. NPDC031894]|uniref:autotransporter domain-containing protein n=1 Tax=Luteibacter sp. NPDC031894 TaxID=3390572 RepID=UPI003D0875F3